MKKLLVSTVILSLALGLHSCSEDFEVSAPYKDITVVYGLLNMRDTAHYVRIQKAFLDENKSAIDMAKEADSNFHNSLDVRVKELSGAAVVDVIQLQRVDMNTEGYPKQPGAFFTSPNYAYKFKKALNPANRYRLVILNNNTGDVDSSEISIVDSNDIKVTWKPVFSFGRLVPATSAKYQIFVNPTTDVRYLEGVVRFHWVDSNLNTGELRNDSTDYMFASKAPDGQAMEVLHTSLYTALKDAMQPPPADIVRLMDSVDMFIYGGGVDFYNYITTTQLQSGGLTADQVKPIYTNLKGGDVYGIFSTRNYAADYNIPIDDLTIDSLRLNAITAPLMIRGRSSK